MKIVESMQDNAEMVFLIYSLTIICSLGVNTNKSLGPLRGKKNIHKNE